MADEAGVSSFELRWWSAERGWEDGVAAHQRERSFRSPDEPLYSFLRGAEVRSRVVGVDVCIDGRSLAERLNAQLDKPCFDTPACLWNMIPLMERWTRSRRSWFVAELRHWMGERLSEADYEQLAREGKGCGRELFSGPVQMFGCACCGDKTCGWWGLPVEDDGRFIHWRSPDLGHLRFEREAYRAAFADTLALVAPRPPDRSVYGAWRAARARRAEAQSRAQRMPEPSQ